MLKLSLKSLQLLQKTINTTGDKTPDPRSGVGEIDALRLLNGEESSQRRHLNKAMEPILVDMDNKRKELVERHNNLVEDIKKDLRKKNPKNDKEKEEIYDVRIDRLTVESEKIKNSLKEIEKEFVNILGEIKELDLTDKTKEVIFKYFKEYGNKVGFQVDEDDMVEEINQLVNESGIPKKA